MKQYKLTTKRHIKESYEQPKNESRINIQEHISIARKTLYSLILVELNGKGGLNPKTAYKIYQAYVLSRLLYGLEILPLNLKHIGELRQFHIKSIRCFQSPPIRTSTSAVHLLIGAIPIEAELHKRQHCTTLAQEMNSCPETITQIENLSREDSTNASCSEQKKKKCQTEQLVDEKEFKDDDRQPRNNRISTTPQ
ncbi:unnamed protein product [Mytilus coruscus]|uniref:Uncharacterized protein n=1 Tax=Mytilus coruscus TaxID=42192 RepID=A0A6J8AF36_MYTCO|nr:unnamed protein product [Mytilus coruscus]